LPSSTQSDLLPDLTGPATNISGANGLLSGIEIGSSINAGTFNDTPIVPLSALGPDSALPFTQSADLSPSLGPATASSGLLTTSQSLEPKMAPRDVPVVVAGPSTAAIPPTFRERLQRGQQAPAFRPRVTTSGPRPPPLDGKGDRALDAVERPRQPRGETKKVDDIKPF
jgi:hypothetical protein